MKTIGLVGGTSWISSLEYYRLFNTLTNERKGGNEAAKVILYSVNYGDIVDYTKQGDWDAIAEIICEAAAGIERAGADCVLIGANTMHYIADRVERTVKIPLIHIADVVADAILRKGASKVALLGTRYTMQMDFYRDKLAARGIETLLPAGADIDFVNDAIYSELGKGQFLPATKQRFLDLVDDLSSKGAEGVILGCTEIPMLISQEDTPVILYDTTLIHATAAVDFALA